MSELCCMAAWAAVFTDAKLSQIMGQVNPIFWDMRVSPYDKKVAEFLRKRRGDQTYRDFAPTLGMSRSALHRLENLVGDLKQRTYLCLQGNHVSQGRSLNKLR
jgi:hypothetical protein